MDVAGLSVGIVGFAFSIYVYARERTTRSHLQSLQRHVEEEHGVRDLCEALVTLRTVVALDPPTSVEMLRSFDQRWTEASAVVWGHLDAARSHVPEQTLLAVEQCLSSTASHIDVLREAGYVAPSFDGLSKSLMETLAGAERLRAALKRRTTR